MRGALTTHPQFSRAKSSCPLSWGGMKHKANLVDEELERLRQGTEATGFFGLSGTDFKCLIGRPLSEEDIKRLIGWLRELVQTVTDCGSGE